MDRALLCAAMIAAVVGCYPIAIYPVLVRLVARVRPRGWKEGRVSVEVAHVITVHNEERRIGAKLENALAVRYPGGRADIVVTSDGSTDGTEAIVRTFAPRGVRWLSSPRRSKEHAQIEAVRQTNAPILVFSDASTMLESGSVEALLAPLADPEVGATSGADVIATAGPGTGEEIYVPYEMALRRAESLAGSLVGLSGCFFAARREIAREFKDDVPSDLGAALICLSRGLRAVHVDPARCTYATTPEVDREFLRKRRTALRGIRGLIAYKASFAGRRPVATWQLVSHKLLRFLTTVFFALSAGLLLAAAAIGSRPAALLAGIGLAAVAVASVSLAWAPARRYRLPRALGFFLLSNAAVAAALLDLVIGRTAVSWTPTRRA